MTLKITLENKLKNIFKKELQIKVTLKNKIYDFKNWDSLGNFNLLLSCEKIFKIKFNAKEFNKTNSYKELLKLIKKKYEF